MLCCFASTRNKPKYNSTNNTELIDKHDTNKDIKNIETEEQEEPEEQEVPEVPEEQEEPEEKKKIEEIETINEYIEDLKTEICLLCNKFVKLNELYLIEIEKTHINVCEKCHNLKETEIIELFNKKCTKFIKEKTITIKYNQKNYIFVKYANEDLNSSIDKFIKLIGINKNKNHYINLIKNKLIEK